MNLTLISILLQSYDGTVTSLDNLVGEKGPSWLLSSSDFKSTNRGIRFTITGVRGESYTSDIAIDDVGVQNCAG